MNNSGAQQGLLLLEQEGEWVIQAAVTAEQSHPQVMQAIRLSDFDEISQTIVRYVARTQKIVILGDAARNGQFVQDPYLQHRQVKSILCMPLLNQGQCQRHPLPGKQPGSGRFHTRSGGAVRGNLTGQMTVSLDNARLL